MVFFSLFTICLFRWSLCCSFHSISFRTHIFVFIYIAIWWHVFIESAESNFKSAANELWNIIFLSFRPKIQIQINREKINVYEAIIMVQAIKNVPTIFSELTKRKKKNFKWNEKREKRKKKETKPRTTVVRFSFTAIYRTH